MLCVSQVLIAVGRDACTGKIGLDKAGVKVNAKYVSFFCMVYSGHLSSQSLLLVVVVALERAGSEAAPECHGESAELTLGTEKCVQRLSRAHMDCVNISIHAY